MKTKKFISTIVSISIIAASAAVPVFADYEAPEESYDVERFNYTFDDGTTENSIDGSMAKQYTEFGEIFKVSDASVFASEFYLSFDFRFDTQDDGTTVDGYIHLNNEKNGNYTNKVGPNFSYGTTKATGGALVLRNQTSISAWTKIADINPDEWYTAELEGKTYASTRMTVYDAEHNVVGETTSLYLRNFATDTKNGNPNVLVANHVSIDNVKLISENPNKLILSSNDDEINAGSNTSFSYEAYRDDTAVTKPSVTWSVYDADNSNEITDGSISINDNGVLAADISSSKQTVTVRATAVIDEKELIGTKQISVNAIDTSDEKFDAITISGADSVKAGTETEYTVTATKNSVDVTDTLSSDDVIWSIYDFDNLNPIYANGSEQIKASVENGVLKVADNTLPQSFTIRAASNSGNVYDSKTVTTEFSASQKESVVYYNAYETTLGSENKAVSVDGSTAYLATASTGIWSTANQDGYTMTEMDIKFTQDGAGFTLQRRDGQKTNTSISYSGGNLKTNTNVLMSGADTDTWYHIELLYSTSDASCNIYEYDENGKLGKPVRCLNIDRRNATAYGKLQIDNGACIDNVIIYTPIANEISVTAPGQYMFAGETAQFTATASRNGLPISGDAGVTWTVLDEEGLPIIDGTVTVDETGLLTVDSLAGAQTITVAASTLTGASDSAVITVQIAEIFTVTNLGINEAGDTIVKLYVDKNFYYNDDVTFIVAIKDEDGILKAVKIINTFGDRLSLGSNELTTELALPAGFNADTYSVEAMVWTTF